MLYQEEHILLLCIYGVYYVIYTIMSDKACFQCSVGLVSFGSVSVLSQIQEAGLVVSDRLLSVRGRVLAGAFCVVFLKGKGS